MAKIASCFPETSLLILARIEIEVLFVRYDVHDECLSILTDKIEYLQKTRPLYYNDDYLEFLVKGVWKISEPVNIVDFGCGYGFLGLKLLPLLPEGSKYTGVDKGRDLIAMAESLFSDTPYLTEFHVSDVDEFQPDAKFDIAVCHALLLHMSDPKKPQIGRG